MPCPNCGSYQRLGPCYCTWTEIAAAIERKKQAAKRFAEECRKRAERMNREREKARQS